MSVSPFLDTIARLLATENINVVRSNVHTASFNIDNRTLTLPQWNQITAEIDEMLVSHEVSHALFTTSEYQAAIKQGIDDPVNSVLGFPSASVYLNILEDARVEKLMKRRYPGIRKTFAIGYNQLNDMDFFEVKNKDFDLLLLIDKINLYFKVGYGCGVKFSSEEKVFVTRAELTETIEEVIQLARDVYDFTAQTHQKQKLEIQQNNEQESMMFDGEENEGQQSDDDFDSESEQGDNTTEDDGGNNQDTDSDSEEYEDQLTSSGYQGSETPPAPTTMQAFDKRVAEIADTETQYTYYTLQKPQYDPIIPYHRIFSIIENVCNVPCIQTDHDAVRSFKNDNQNNVDYLIKEFELKKAATSYKKATTCKMGAIDTKKLWSYQINPDIFKRVTLDKKGQNHGMIFLLDWSGSMYGHIEDTLDQLINLVLFCHKANIVYNVYAFTDNSNHINFNPIPYQFNPTEINSYHGRFHLLELFSNKMSMSDITKMMLMIKSRNLIRTFGMHGTPLNSSLIHIYNILAEFQTKNNIEKVTLITLTDGLGEQLFEPGTMSTLGGKRKCRTYIRDVYTKKNYSVTGDAASHTKTILDMIKDRYNCTVLGFHIERSHYHALYNTIRSHYADLRRHEIDVKVDYLKSMIRKQGYASLKNTGRDDLFIVPPASTKIVDHVIKVDGQSTARTIAKELNKFMNTKKSSRILLTKFIEYVA